MLTLLLQSQPPIDQLTNLGVAGIMGMMWLWERKTSRVREQQIDEAHARIMSDRVMLDQLMDLMKQNTEAMTRLCAQMRTATPSPREGRGSG